MKTFTIKVKEKYVVEKHVKVKANDYLEALDIAEEQAISEERTIDDFKFKERIVSQVHYK